MIGNYQICISRHFSGITHLTTEVIIHLTGIITGSYKQKQEYDYTAHLAGYTILSKRDNHGWSDASRPTSGETVPSCVLLARSAFQPTLERKSQMNEQVRHLVSVQFRH